MFRTPDACGLNAPAEVARSASRGTEVGVGGATVANHSDLRA